jgi:hypothetical protein
MSGTAAQVTGRRDLLLMPLIGILTIAVVAVTAELLARAHHFYESAAGMAACLDDSDPARGVRGIPNSVCREKSLESDDIEIRLDSRGYRSDWEPGPKRSDVYRIVLIGSSVALGERTQFENSPAALLAPRIAALSGTRVEVYSEGMAWGFARNADLRFQDAIDLQPDLILWVVTPLDIARSEETLVRQPDSPPPANGIGRLKYQVLQYIRSHGGDIVIGQVLRHYLYELQSEKQFVRSAVQNLSPDDELGFLYITQGPAWQQHWADFTAHARDMFTRARAADIPMAVVFAPNRLQAAMISQGVWPAGFDPYGINRSVQSRTAAQGATFIGILPHYAAVPGSEHLYLALDGHPTDSGYHFLAQAIAEELTSGAIPRLARAPTAGSL